MNYLFGNIGLNNHTMGLYKEPLKIVSKDFNNDGKQSHC